MHVVAPDPGGQAIGGVIGQCDGLVQRAKGQHHQNRAEHLFAGDGHVGGHAAHHGRLIKLIAKARNGQTAAADAHLGPGCDRRTHIAINLGRMFGRHDGPDLRVGMQRVAKGHLPRQRDHPRHKGICDILVNDDPAGGIAALADVEVDAKGHGIGGALQITIRKDHLRVLAAQLQRHLFQGVTSTFGDQLAHRR